ncbi:hypothetical protein LWI28_016253 [Acer negundo]|uniref:Amino acid transporter transmembrane domain-containing protein n=1 Tax=Acer negundo TaxID=4023 RepID=A0AAD5NVW5_ACENE|nr:hypothetical protein LWI28_016253 [Acer negundo]
MGEAPLLLQKEEEEEEEESFVTMRTVAHIITGVIGSGVLSLAWCVAQLGWIAGPFAIVFFAAITLTSAFLLCDCYRTPDPEHGPGRNRSYSEAVAMSLDKKITTLGCYSHSHLSPHLLSLVSTIELVWFDSLGEFQSPPTDFSFWGRYTTPGNLLTGFGFYEPSWLIDFANACIIIHLVGGYQLYSQPLFANAERVISDKYPHNGFIKNEFSLKLPLIPAFQLSLLRLCFRTAYVVFTTVIGMTFPYFNEVIGVMGGIIFWPLTIYFPVEMYFKQRNVEACTKQWVMLRIFTTVCFLVTMFALVGSIEGLIRAKMR